MSEGGTKLTICPAHDDGTNGLIVPSDLVFAPRLGHESFKRHMEEASELGLSIDLFSSPGFESDLDTVDDLRRCVEIGAPGIAEYIRLSRGGERVKFGVLLPSRRLVMEGGDPRRFREIIDLAQSAEDAGLDSVWVGDSLTAKPRLEPLSTLTAVAQHTDRVRLGSAVLLAALRHPVHLAHQAATVDFISGGRLVLGAGVGGAFNDAQRREWKAAGVDSRTRASRFEEVVEIANALTRGVSVDFDGRHFRLHGCFHRARIAASRRRSLPDSRSLAVG